ncbi:MAG TPA: SIMPL domain-containing protein [Candidatus Paceibacterota bacterium]|nr:SIMPL domain-containing protein [Candidatus Paceibacterota bacterium]
MAKINPSNFWQYTLGIFLIIISIVALVAGWGISYVISNMPPEHTLTVSGEGKIFAKPDVAIVEMSVISQHKNVELAQSENDQKMQQVVNFLKESGIDEKDIKTTQYNLQPEYDYSWCRTTEYPVYCPPKLVDYMLTQSLQVKIRDLSRVGKIIGNLSEIGVNQISDISFVIDNDTEIKAAARQKAIAEAKQKAQEMANAANIELGKIIEINESVSGLTPQRIVYQKTIESADATAPIEIGTNEIVVSVSLIYEIK